MYVDICTHSNLKLITVTKGRRGCQTMKTILGMTSFFIMIYLQIYNLKMKTASKNYIFAAYIHISIYIFEYEEMFWFCGY